MSSSLSVALTPFCYFRNSRQGFFKLSNLAFLHFHRPCLWSSIICNTWFINKIYIYRFLHILSPFLPLIYVIAHFQPVMYRYYLASFYLITSHE